MEITTGSRYIESQRRGRSHVYDNAMRRVCWSIVDRYIEMWPLRSRRESSTQQLGSVQRLKTSPWDAGQDGTRELVQWLSHRRSNRKVSPTFVCGTVDELTEFAWPVLRKADALCRQRIIFDAFDVGKGSEIWTLFFEGGEVICIPRFVATDEVNRLHYKFGGTKWLKENMPCACYRLYTAVFRFRGCANHRLFYSPRIHIRDALQEFFNLKSLSLLNCRAWWC